jgi:hypothetical protein
MCPPGGRALRAAGQVPPDRSGTEHGSTRTVGLWTWETPWPTAEGSVFAERVPLPDARAYQPVDLGSGAPSPYPGTLIHRMAGGLR